MTRCQYDPSPLIGVPLGMFHCPACGCMVIAGLAHGACEPGCPEEDEADRAARAPWEIAADAEEP